MAMRRSEAAALPMPGLLMLLMRHTSDGDEA